MRCQFQAHNNLVGDTATAYGGLQHINTSDGHQLLLSICSGLPYICQTYPINDDMKLLHVQFTSPAEWNPNLNNDHRTSEEMIRRFPPVPQDATNSFYDETGKINYKYLYKRKNKNVEIEHDDDSVGTMSGLQVRDQEEDSDSSVDDSDCAEEQIRLSTTIEWNDPINDSDGEKIVCP